MSSLLVVEFGDNDFGHYIKDALENLYLDTENIYNHSTDSIKRYIIAHIIGCCSKKHALWKSDFDENSTKKYLEKIRVSFKRELPRYEPNGEFVDDDGGSAAINLATGFTFVF